MQYKQTPFGLEAIERQYNISYAARYRKRGPCRKSHGARSTPKFWNKQTERHPMIYCLLSERTSDYVRVCVMLVRTLLRRYGRWALPVCTLGRFSGASGRPWCWSLGPLGSWMWKRRRSVLVLVLLYNPARHNRSGSLCCGLTRRQPDVASRPL